jgi:hypothetical protein
VPHAVAATGIVLDYLVGRVLSEYRLASLTLLLDNGLFVNHNYTGKFYDALIEEPMLCYLCLLHDQERSIPLAQLLVQRGADTKAKSGRGLDTVLKCGGG